MNDTTPAEGPDHTFYYKPDNFTDMVNAAARAARAARSAHADPDTVTRSATTAARAIAEPDDLRWKDRADLT